MFNHDVAALVHGGKIDVASVRGSLRTIGGDVTMLKSVPEACSSCLSLMEVAHTSL